jgi:putative ABC transport system substrate-binding protein
VKRREVIAGLAWTLSAGFAFGQMPARRPRVMTLWTTTALVAAPYVKEFEEGLTERGWMLGRMLEVDHRFTDGQPERLSSLAAEIVAARPDVIMSGLNTGAVALHKLTTDIPIVVASALDPVGSGLAQSIARPGWNVTGNVIPHEQVLKRIQIMRDIIPNLRRIAILYNEAAPGIRVAKDALHDAARQFGIEVHDAPLTAPQDLALAMKGIVESGCEAIFALPNDNLFFLLRKEITAAARQHRIATMLGSHEGVRDGGLIAYTPNLLALFRRASYFVDRVLRGSQPGELPFEQPTRYDLVINLATARALGITIPERVLSTADEAIE